MKKKNREKLFLCKICKQSADMNSILYGKRKHTQRQAFDLTLEKQKTESREKKKSTYFELNVPKQKQ